MPTASSKRATPARKKAKLDVATGDASTSSDADKPVAYAADTVIENATAQPNVAAGSSTTKPTRARATRAAAARPNYRELPAEEETAKPGTTDVSADASAANSSATEERLQSTPPPPHATPAPSTPLPQFKTPAAPRPSVPRSAKGKAKAKLEEDDDYDDDDDGPSSGKTPDVEVYTHEGPLSALNRIQMKTQKPRSLRPLWLQGVYHPPFFGVPPSSLVAYFSNEDAGSQPDEVRKREVGKALSWPTDGHVKTWLDPSAYALIKKQLLKFWFGQVGWVPKEGVYDWGWWPGKAFGWKQNVEMSERARDAKAKLLSNSSATSAAIVRRNQPGWPFVQPWIDAQLHTLKLLSSKDAKPFMQDTTTPQQAPLRHPTTVMKLAVPELTMRSRLKQSVVRDSPKTPSRAKTTTKANSGGAGADREAADEDEEAAAAADEDEEAIAALDANQEPVNLSDPKFADIPNLGFEEKGSICGDVLHVSIGPTDQEVPVQIPKGTAKRLDSLGVVPDEGHVMNVGGHVYALDWVPVPVHLNTGKEYFVVSAANSQAPLTMIGAKEERPAKASLQIWSVAPDGTQGEEKKDKGEARLEMVVCHDIGTAYKLAWCPIGYDYADGGKQDQGKDATAPRRLGLLAGCFADGSLSVFSVPHPELLSRRGKSSSQEPVYVQLEPILTLTHPQQTATSLAWAGGELLAFGGSRGWLGVFNIGRILRSSHSANLPPMPDHVVRAHRSAITDLTFVLLPTINSDGVAQHSSLPRTIFSVSLDGLTCLSDLVRCEAKSVERSRTIHHCCAFSSFSGGSLLHEHADGSLAHYSLRPEEMLRSRTVTHTPSRITSMDASPFHPMVAVGTAHGEVKVANALRTLRRSQRNHLAVWQQVLDRGTGELKVRTHLLPEIANKAEAREWHVGAWSGVLAVTAVRWNRNLRAARLMLSGTRVGLVVVGEVRPPWEEG
ncbi:hypothetical protein PHSY_002970 [Pseudozyma hubeiensis SY62]|uniref:Uncharacterized protein n=1 Tax=Pseudozyma hubeiensis (strain SY62) TaxID=1305764 RepID=R9PBF9_PSEHS|nr:hypothetical protein PHSY_002970 [Pseudozyma hubeiensis SY62]GAC95395.1 hypothetical protein PHSY_002970 [Pseudozyma hubeiensis SY62]